nr:probable cytochrome P450 12c1, mitochondrial [Dermacentor andersoni]
MRTSSGEALAGDATCTAYQGAPGRKFLVKTGAPDSGKGPGRHPRSSASFYFSYFKSAVDRRSRYLDSTSGYAGSSMNTSAGAGTAIGTSSRGRRLRASRSQVLSRTVNLLVTILTLTSRLMTSTMGTAHSDILTGTKMPSRSNVDLGLTLDLGELPRVVLRTEWYVAGRLEENFSRATTFLPERWLQRSSEQEHHSGKAKLWTLHPFASLPFGTGPRTCIGKRIAEMELCTLLTQVLKRYRVQSHHGAIGFSTQATGRADRPVTLQFIDLEFTASSSA